MAIVSAAHPVSPVGLPMVTDPRQRVVDVGALLGIACRSLGATPRSIRRGTFPVARQTATCLVTEGLVMHQVRVGRRLASDLLGPGDLLRLDGDEGPFVNAVQALERSSVVQLHIGRMAAAEPALLAATVAAAEARGTRLAVQHVAAQCAGLDERLQILLPWLAERCGTVTRDGVMLPASLSHSALAQIFCVRRPSLTTATARWAQEGVLVRMSDGRWRIGDGALPALGAGGG